MTNEDFDAVLDRVDSVWSASERNVELLHSSGLIRKD